MESKTELIRLYDQYADSLYRLALSYLKNVPDAEDTVQTVFIRLIEGKAKLLPGKERALLTRMTINCCRDQLRAFWRKRCDALPEQVEFSAPQDAELFCALLALPEKYRIALYLHYYEGFSCGETASLLHISASAVSMRLHRGRKLLKTQLGG